MPQMQDNQAPIRKQSDEIMDDPELAAAIAQSLQENLEDDNDESFGEANNVATKEPPKVVQKIYPAPKPEPPKDSNSTGLRITLPDGKTIRRRFLKSDPVSELYAFIEHEHDVKFNDLSKYVLIMPFPKITLGHETLSKTLEELQLLRVSLTLTEV